MPTSESSPPRLLCGTAAASSTASIGVFPGHDFVIAELLTTPETEGCLARDEASLMLAQLPASTCPGARAGIVTRPPPEGQPAAWRTARLVRRP